MKRLFEGQALSKGLKLVIKIDKLTAGLANPNSNNATFSKGFANGNGTNGNSQVKKFSSYMPIKDRRRSHRYRLTSLQNDFIKQDLLRLQQVMANLISNSIKYSTRGVIQIKGESFISVEGKRMFKVKVRDQGIGIKDTSLIGQMFSQLQLKDNVNQNGIGFGLTISKMIMQKLGGTLVIESNKKNSMFGARPEDQRGLTVIITFPDLTPPDQIQTPLNEFEQSIDYDEEEQVNLVGSDLCNTIQFGANHILRSPTNANTKGTPAFNSSNFTSSLLQNQQKQQQNKLIDTNNQAIIEELLLS